MERRKGSYMKRVQNNEAANRNVFTRRTFTTEDPLTIAEVKKFADAVAVGESYPVLYIKRTWTESSMNAVEEPVAEMVTIEAKYPHMVKTDRCIISWKDFVMGYHRCPGVKCEVEEAA